MDGAVCAVVLQSQNGRSLMEIGIVLDNFGVRNIGDDIFEQNSIRR
jgi:hypothetical protein